MEFTNDTLESIERHFSVLRHIGYRPYSQVNNLIVMIFIEELLNSSMSQFITEDDYRSINNAIECLYGTCMIPYPTYKQAISEVQDKSPDLYRTTEDGRLKIAETIGLRIMS